MAEIVTHISSNLVKEKTKKFSPDTKAKQKETNTSLKLRKLLGIKNSGNTMPGEQSDKEFATECPLTSNATLPDASSVPGNPDSPSRQRRPGVSERCKEDRTIFKQALKNHISAETASSCYLE